MSRNLNSFTCSGPSWRAAVGSGWIFVVLSWLASKFSWRFSNEYFSSHSYPELKDTFGKFKESDIIQWFSAKIFTHDLNESPVTILSEGLFLFHFILCLSSNAKLFLNTLLNLKLYLCFHIIGFSLSCKGVVLCSICKQELCSCVVLKKT